MKYICSALILINIVFHASAQKLSVVEEKIVSEVAKNHAANLKLLEEIVNINSGSLNVA